MKYVTAWGLILAGLSLAQVQASSLTVTQQATRAGITTCLPVIEQLETWLSRNQTGDALSYWDSGSPNTHLFSAVMALDNPTTGNSIANINVVPSPNGQCMVEYTRTGYVARSCADYLSSLGSQARYVRDLNNRTALVQGQGIQILLSPAGPNGCLWVNKEITRQNAAPAAAAPKSVPKGKPTPRQAPKERR